MDEESLFRSIHDHLLRQAESNAADEAADTEVRLADRFGVSRYHVRRALDTMTRMGVVTRTQNRGIVFSRPEPEAVSERIGSHLGIGGFSAYELTEARALFGKELLTLAVRRLPPAELGTLADLIERMRGCIEFRGAALEFHRRFWETVFRAGGNRVLQVFATALLLHAMTEIGRRADELPDTWYSNLLEFDEEVLAAFRREDADRASALLAEWLKRAEAFGL